MRLVFLRLIFQPYIRAYLLVESCCLVLPHGEVLLVCNMILGLSNLGVNCYQYSIKYNSYISYSTLVIFRLKNNQKPPRWFSTNLLKSQIQNQQNSQKSKIIYYAPISGLYSVSRSTGAHGPHYLKLPDQRKSKKFGPET